jgi:hypothetical protein
VNPKARSDARGADQTGAAGRRLKQVAPNALTGPKRLSDRVGHVASVEIAHWAATAFGILIVKNQLVKNQRPSAADQNGKAAAIAGRNTVLTTLQEAGLIAGFGDWFNPVAISPR